MELQQQWKSLTSRLWFRPTVWTLVCAALALGLTSLDHRLARSHLLEQLPLAFAGGTASARTILGAIATAILTVTTLTYSIIIVAMVQAANAFSPRVLRQYLADPSQQHALGILIGTFLFNLLSLRAVESTEEATFVPAFSVNVAILLSLAAIGAFIYSINRSANSIRVGQIVSLVMRDTQNEIDRLFPEMIGQPAEPPADVEDRGERSVVACKHSGYVDRVDGDKLLTVANENEVVVELLRLPGDYVVLGTPIAHVWPADTLDEDLADAILGALNLAKERTMTQDPLYGARQLSDIALRALSSGINDPSTAEHCIDALASLLARLASRDPVSPYRVADGGPARVIANGPTFESMLDMAFSRIRLYAAGDLTCTRRLITACADVGLSAQSATQRDALWTQVQTVARSADRHLAEPVDRAEINACLVDAAERLGREDPPLLDPHQTQAAGP